MKTLVTFALAGALLVISANDASARKSRKKSQVARPAKSKVIRTRTRARTRPPTTLAENSDEITLSPNLMRDLQHNLVEGGYLVGTVDGRLTRRTRRAIAEFQRDYHMPGTGALDRSTAEALLGHETISRFIVAEKN
jgi:peptidoglycan hydrolase-like protein with peptidoglycan-binding domain